VVKMVAEEADLWESSLEEAEVAADGVGEEAVDLEADLREEWAVVGLDGDAAEGEGVAGAGHVAAEEVDNKMHVENIYLIFLLLTCK